MVNTGEKETSLGLHTVVGTQVIAYKKGPAVSEQTHNIWRARRYYFNGEKPGILKGSSNSKPGDFETIQLNINYLRN